MNKSVYTFKLNKVEELIKKTFNYFKLSNTRRSDFENLGVCMTGEIPLKFKALSKTRWISHFPCIERILLNWEVLKAFFYEVGIKLLL